jgi:hypothetical protein
VTDKDLIESRRKQLNKRFAFRKHLAELRVSNENAISKLVKEIADYKDN